MASRIREAKKDVIDAAKAQYERRGNPTAVTGWTPSDVHNYMRWQFAEMKAGRLKRRDLGGFSWKLPKRSEGGPPAELPKEVVQFLKSQQQRRTIPEEEDDSGSESDYVLELQLGLDDVCFSCEILSFGLTFAFLKKSVINRLPYQYVCYPRGIR